MATFKSPPDWSGCHAILVTARLIVLGSLNIITVLVEMFSDMCSGYSSAKYSSNISISLFCTMHCLAPTERSFVACK